MLNVLQRATATVAAIMASLVFVTTALAQMPTSPWKKGAPFPEPDEELYGVAVNGKMYVIGGWGDGKARGVNYKYDPATDRWTKKQPMPRPAHHAALAAGTARFTPSAASSPRPTPLSRSAPRGTHRQRLGVRSRHRFMEGAAAAARQTRFRDRRSSGRQDLRDRRRHDDGRVEGPVLHGIRARPGARHERGVRPATNKWESRNPMSVPRNHAFSGVVNGKIYVIGGRTGHGFILSATNTDVVEAYDPASNTWSMPKERMPTARSGGASGTDGRRIFVAGGEVTTTELVGAFRAVEPYDPATNSWTTLPSMMMPRHGFAGAVIGNRFHLVSGMIQSAGALTFLDPTLSTHTAAHDIFELQLGSRPRPLRRARRRRLPRTDDRRRLAEVRRDRQRESRPLIVNCFEGDFHVESITTGNRTGCRDNRQPRARHDRAGSGCGHRPGRRAHHSRSRIGSCTALP